MAFLCFLLSIPLLNNVYCSCLDVAESQHSYPDNGPELDLMMQKLARFNLLNLSQRCHVNLAKRAFCQTLITKRAQSKFRSIPPTSTLHLIFKRKQSVRQ